MNRQTSHSLITRGVKRASDGGESPAHKRPSLSVVSPGSKVRVRSELIEQLDRFHKLKESGALSTEEYGELRSNILSDFKNL